MLFSAEQQDKLQHYLVLLNKWQKSINLVSKNSLEGAWKRHILDSAQLSPHIPADKKVMDIGSGAGFPGLVLAIIRPDLEISLLESDERKCVFLRTVSRETNTRVTIYNERIENYTGVMPYDFITARALASLNDLLNYAISFYQKNPALELLFLKGAHSSTEISEAKRSFSFIYKEYVSQTDYKARLLHITCVSRET
jgi:16S rRNA (guanine527-N7)-methyltransferase